MDNQTYICNCISAILAAPAHVSQDWRRHQDIALAVTIAAKDGEVEAWNYLQRVAIDAHAGFYAEPFAPVLP